MTFTYKFIENNSIIPTISAVYSVSIQNTFDSQVGLTVNCHLIHITFEMDFENVDKKGFHIKFYQKYQQLIGNNK